MAACALQAPGAVAEPAPRTPALSPPAPRPVPTGPKLDLSLAEAVFMGLRDNRAVKSAYIERVAQKYDLFVAKTRFAPVGVVAAGYSTTLQGPSAQTTAQVAPNVTWLAPTGATFGFSWARTQTRGPGGDSISDLAALNLSQPLLKGAGLAVNMAPIRLAELQEQINRLALKSTVSNTVTAMVQAYRTLLQAQDQLTITREALGRSNTLLATNRALIEAGRMAATEVIQTEADVANQKVAVLQAEQTRNSAQLALLQLLAMDLRTNVVATDTLEPAHVEVDVGQAVQLAMNNRMDLLAQQKVLEQSRQNLIIAKNDRLWNLSVTGSLQYQHARTSLGATLPPVSGGTTPFGAPISPGVNGVVGVQLSIPIGDFTLQQAEVQAQTALRVAQVQLDDLRQSVEAQVRDAVQGVEMSWRQAVAAREARELAERTLELEREKLRLGRAANFEVLTFEGALRSADTQKLAADVAYLDALTLLDQQLGTTLDTWRIDLND